MFVAILKETLITEDEGQGAFNWLYFHFKTSPPEFILGVLVSLPSHNSG